MSSDELYNLFEEILESFTPCSCNKYYCTTCGGINAIATKKLITVDRLFIENSFLSPKNLNIKESDFMGRNKNTYPSDINVSNYIAFLIHAFNCLSSPQQQTVIRHWIVICNEWQDWFFDGLSYYFVGPIKPQKIWIPIISKRATFDKNIDETYRLKFCK